MRSILMSMQTHCLHNFLQAAALTAWMGLMAISAAATAQPCCNLGPFSTWYCVFCSLWLPLSCLEMSWVFKSCCQEACCTLSAKKVALPFLLLSSLRNNSSQFLGNTPWMCTMLTLTAQALGGCLLPCSLPDWDVWVRSFSPTDILLYRARACQSMKPTLFEFDNHLGVV